MTPSLSSSSSGLSVPSPTPAEVARFQVLYQAETGTSLTDEEALAQLTGLLCVSVVLLHIPSPQTGKEPAKKHPAAPGIDSSGPALLDSTAR